MAVELTTLVKNFLRDKLLESKLLLTREPREITDFFRQISDLNKVMIIVPRDRAEEVFVRKYVTEIRDVFKGVKISILDVYNIRSYDVNWIGVPHEQYIKKLQNEKFDLVIDLNSTHDQLCTYICYFSHAPLRLHLVAGKYDKLYNLQIRMADYTSMDGRFRNLISYLSLLRRVNMDAKVPA